MNSILVYPHSLDYALEHGELVQYRDSRNANIACKEAIEVAISRNSELAEKGYGTIFHAETAVKQVLDQFGLERTAYVIANTLQQKEWDGRFTRQNKEWAKTIPVLVDKDRFGYNQNLHFVVDKSHPVLTDAFATKIRELYGERK